MNFSDRWVYHPNPQSVSKRATELLPELWRNGTSGKGTVENHYGQEVLFVAEWHGEKKGVTAYVHRQHVALPTQRKGAAGSAVVATLAIVAGAVMLARSL